MCGIAGAINTTFSDDFLSTLSHRGPDYSGSVKYHNLELGHRRLSILDPSPSGHQPMSTDNDRFTIVYNGEIYNHQDIRKDLRDHGLSFDSESDTETLLKAWQVWGTDILQRLNGIFAFALLDKQKDKLFLVRDPFGIKPLYIYQKEEVLAFSSELKIFQHLEGFDDRIDPGAFTEYLSFLWAPGETTPYKHVRKLLPGHLLEISLENSREITEQTYYSLPFEGNYMEQASEKELVDRLDDALRTAVDRQLLSDVPLGFFLSGGLDSSLLVAMAHDLHPDAHFDCFTIASNMDDAEEGFADDLPYARKVAKELGVDLHVIPADETIAEQFDHMIWHLDEPQADPAPVNVFNIAKGAREMGIKVLLGGTAGDDLFSGYRRHQALKLDRYLEYVPVPIRKMLKSGIRNVPAGNSLKRRLNRLSRDWDKPLQHRMYGYFNWLPDDRYVYSLFQDRFLKRGASDSVYSYFEQISDGMDEDLSLLDRLLTLEIKTFLVDHNLNYTDKMSMAAGVETRVPYLDMEVVELAGKIPERYKLNGSETKYILKKVAERYLPEEVIYRSKTGFGAPIRSWLKNELRPMVDERLDENLLAGQGIFDPVAVRNMVKENEKGHQDFSYSIWSLLAIQSWLKQFKWSL